MTYDLEYINSLINDKIEESLHLDYKAADALGKSDGKKAEISKDVSAMANSDGGMIIYGIDEYIEPDKRHLPEKISPVQRVEYKKEWLEQIINSNIHPKIRNLLIHSVSLDKVDEVVYIVEIPKSDTAHQAKDKRYYKRYNFESVAMDDYEIRDILNRTKFPKINLLFEFHRLIYTDYPDYVTKHLLRPEERKPQNKVQNVLNVYAQNDGKVYAKYVNYNLYIPAELEYNYKNNIQKQINFNTQNSFVFHGDNTIRDVVDSKPSILIGSPIPVYGTSRYDPLLPGINKRLQQIKLNENIGLDNGSIYWEVYADNAEPLKDAILLSEIPLISEDITKQKDVNQ